MRPMAVAISLSARANQGIELLRTELLRIAGWHPAEDVFIARERHLRALADAQEHIAAAQSAWSGGNVAGAGTVCRGTSPGPAVAR